MRVKEVKFERLVPGPERFGNRRAGVTIRLEKGDDYEAAYEAAKLVVDGELGLAPAGVERGVREAMIRAELETLEGQCALISELKR